jgi:hypothetical protein
MAREPHREHRGKETVMTLNITGVGWIGSPEVDVRCSRCAKTSLKRLTLPNAGEEHG